MDCAQGNLNWRHIEVATLLKEIRDYKECINCLEIQINCWILIMWYYAPIACDWQVAHYSWSKWRKEAGTTIQIPQTKRHNEVGLREHCSSCLKSIKCEMASIPPFSPSSLSLSLCHFLFGEAKKTPKQSWFVCILWPASTCTRPNERLGVRGLERERAGTPQVLRM